MLPEQLSLVITRPPTWTEKRLAMANKMVKHLCEWLRFPMGVVECEADGSKCGSCFIPGRR